MLRFLPCLLFCWAAGLFAQSVQSLPAPVLQALNAAKIPAQSVAVLVEPLDTPNAAPLVSHNARQSMNPASVMKLVTTYAALELLGPATTWQTAFWTDAAPDAAGRLPGNLYLKGSGDPKLVLESFWLMLRQLQLRGIRHIEGDLVLDRSVFDVLPYDPASFDQRPMRAYNVGPDGLLVDYRALRLTLWVEENTVQVRNETPSEGLRIEARLQPGKGGCDGWRDRLDLRYSPGLFSLRGNYPVSCGQKALTLAPLPADRHVEGLFRALWRELGGTLKGRVRAGTVPASASLLFTHDSPPVAEVIRDVNKWSNNVMARQIFLTLGSSAAGEGTTELKARLRIREWLRQKGLDFPELVLENGSGLSREERISAVSLNRLLRAAWQSAVMPEFVASLPIAGLDGTMSTRLKRTAAEGRAHIKTGTLDGVKTIAGYAQDIHGRHYALTFMINHANAAHGQLATNQLLLWLIQGRPAGSN
ncbi:MAG: D-alanyl-D-alanine carboxypeptidase/D-alanyl-D-alanine-endopeptidase [Zoogloeaceae bacterium]|jgi:D-alanyl-D-alanine carboxypeptidase/D-alanyl-D-alanine-endopeptidase (penicillin-binding protein 4)|nr:D-alanyl-D-alanine carboxypeptidase/D-alanyl-D-alanine-endopeptidase [Zoogloeaceae bacterium]